MRAGPGRRGCRGVPSDGEAGEQLLGVPALLRGAAHDVGVRGAAVGEVAQRLGGVPQAERALQPDRRLADADGGAQAGGAVQVGRHRRHGAPEAGAARRGRSRARVMRGDRPVRRAPAPGRRTASRPLHCPRDDRRPQVDPEALVGQRAPSAAATAGRARTARPRSASAQVASRPQRSGSASRTVNVRPSPVPSSLAKRTPGVRRTRPRSSPIRSSARGHGGGGTATGAASRARGPARSRPAPALGQRATSGRGSSSTLLAAGGSLDLVVGVAVAGLVCAAASR